MFLAPMRRTSLGAGVQDATQTGGATPTHVLPIAMNGEMVNRPAKD